MFVTRTEVNYKFYVDEIVEKYMCIIFLEYIFYAFLSEICKIWIMKNDIEIYLKYKNL